ncbi:hypothetical protein PFFCH_02588 [Plasmodium falciparum FCH/4]|uniref:Uncharacterized protein n=1 Tax=Plasmodium falciparum FCH/4 TaxID=1036724 RepID=A0A024VNW6_PLAFA|nr:hypothetical protein PFFCH_02588 [Plasmodium falciparum FCH/4]
MMEKKVYVNLDDQYIDEDIIKTENMLFKIPEAIGGYTFINYIENVPNNYIFPINKNLYEGIHVYKKEEINISHLWRNLHKEYLKIQDEEGRSYKHTYNIRRKLNEEQNDAKSVTVDDIQKEKKSLIENHKKELRVKKKKNEKCK